MPLDPEFDQLLEYHKLISRRKFTVENMLHEWDVADICDCAKEPDCPRCVLNAELELLRRYLGLIDRQLWYIKENGHA